MDGAWTEARLLSRTIPQSGPYGTCRLWTGAKTGNGYGSVTLSQPRRVEPVHRLMFKLVHGEPDGLVRHKCGRELCIEPTHLLDGTQLENAADREEHGRTARGEKNGRAKLTEADVRAIRASGMSQSQLAARYGVSSGLISHVIARRAWRHVV